MPWQGLPSSKKHKTYLVSELSPGILGHVVGVSESVAVLVKLVVVFLVLVAAETHVASEGTEGENVKTRFIYQLKIMSTD